MTRGASGPVVIEIKYRERPRTTANYLSSCGSGGPRGSRSSRRVACMEARAIWKTLPASWSTIVDKGKQLAVSFLTRMIRGWIPHSFHQIRSQVNTLGQLADHPRVAALRRFITGWYVSYLSADSARGQPEAGPRERLSRTGDNLANVIQYLGERHGQRLDEIFKTLGKRVPHVERVLSDVMPDGRLLLQIKDAPFDHPILARYSSDGTLKMLAYLVLLHDPYPPPFIGIEEPENFLHPRLLYGLAEECRGTSEDTQLLVTTHSPYFLDALRAKEVRVLWRE